MKASLRLKLTLWYGGLVFVAGALIVTAAVLLARHNVGPVRATVASSNQTPPDFLPQRRLTEDAWGRTIEELAVVLGLLTLGSLGAGWFAAGRALRPIKHITTRARDFSERDLSQRIALQGPNDELKVLADGLDDMLDRLNDVVTSQRRFIADASHELRTPLAVMRAGIEVTLDDPEAPESEVRAATETLRESIERSDQLVRSLLALARSEGAAETRELVDLAAVAAAAFHELSDEIEKRGLAVQAEVVPAEITGHPVLLRTLASNLLRNAVTYNRPRGSIELRVGRTSEHAFLRVTNTGVVVLEEDVPSLFLPFRRLDHARRDGTGAGLGLSIVRSVAEGHGGSVRAKALPLGGLDVVVELPLASPGPESGPAEQARRLGRRDLARVVRRLLAASVVAAFLVALAYGALSAGAAGVRIYAARKSDDAARRGARAFPVAWRGMSEANLVRIAGKPTWSGPSSTCARFLVGGGVSLVPCANGDRCLEYGDVESDSSTEFCFQNGLLSKRRWPPSEWLAIVNGKAIGSGSTRAARSQHRERSG